MKSILPKVTYVAFGLIALGTSSQPAAAQSTATATDRAVAPRGGTERAEELLGQAIAKLEKCLSVSARTRQKVDLLGQQLIGSGIYLQQGAGLQRRLRMELKMQADDQSNLLEQVCDGRYLWVHQELLGETTLARIDLQRVGSAVMRTSPRPAVPFAMPIAQGGLPKLLAGLQNAFRFTSVQQVRLDNLAVYALEGSWRMEKLAELVPEEKTKINSGQFDFFELPPQVPQRVVLVLGSDDLFPYRIEYLRSRNTKAGASLGDGDFHRLVLMELFEVQIDAAIDPRYFVYQPGGQEIVDQTSAYLKSLGISETDGASAKVAPITSQKQ